MPGGIADRPSKARWRWSACAISALRLTPVLFELGRNRTGRGSCPGPT